MQTRRTRIRWIAALALAGGAACSGTAKPSAPTPDPYLYAAPPASVPVGLEQATWLSHHHDDLLPYWQMDAAKGIPVGNFPTYRGMDGSLAANSLRKPRMMGRQIFTYSIGYLLTGDESLLDLARAGNAFLLAHGRDTARGGWYADLDATGAQFHDYSKMSQDFAYTVMGPAAYFFVTADADAESAVLDTRDLLFNPASFWDAANGRIKDGLTPDLGTEVFVHGQGSWELVAQLDPVTAFLLLVQPVLSDPARQAQVLGDLRTLALRVHDSFWRDGFFWGYTGALDQFGTAHSDFGHMLKSYWALTQIDKRLPDEPLKDFLTQYAASTLNLAYDTPNGRWANQPNSASGVDYGADWWAFAEADNLGATLALHDPKWIPVVATAATHFRGDFVDRTRAAREVVSSINRDGSWPYPWPDSDTAKCNEWKNGFHTAEHALVMYLFSSWASNTPAQLYFAFPAAQAMALGAAARPYTFLGHVAKVEDLGALVGDATRHKVRVSFDQLR